MRRSAILIAAILSLSSYQSTADEYHYKNILNGAKAAGLGGAYISVADDLTAMLYNPAGLSYSDVSSTASMSVLSWESTSFDGVFSDNSDFERDSFIVVPGFFGFRVKHNDWDFGVSFTVADFSKERTSQDIFYDVPENEGLPPQANNEFISIDLDNVTYKSGASLAYKINDHLSIGSTIFLNYREFTSVQGSGIATQIALPTGDYSLGFSASRRISDQHISIEPLLGILWKQGDLSLGAKAAYDIPISRDYEATSTIYVLSSEALPEGINPVTRLSSTSDEKQKFPLELGLGASYQFDKFLISADINYFTKVDSNSTATELINIPITRTLAQTTNYSLGVEYAFTQKTALRFGIFTDNANSIIDTNIDFERVEQIDLIGISTSLSTEILTKDVTFGMYYREGTGSIRFADIRAVESIANATLYPPSENNDIASTKKQSFVAFMSLDF